MPWNVATITTIGYLCPHNHEDMRICHRRKDGDMRMGGRGAGRSDDPLAMPSNQRSIDCLDGPQFMLLMTSRSYRIAQQVRQVSVAFKLVHAE